MNFWKKNGLNILISLCLAAGGLLGFLSAFAEGEYANALLSPRNGLLLTANAFLTFFTRATGRIYLLFDCVPNRDYLFAAVFLFLLLFVLSFYALRRTVIPALVLSLGVAAGYGFGLFRSDAGVLLYGVGFLLMLAQRRQNSADGKAFLCRAVGVAVCLSVLFAALPAQSAPQETLRTKTETLIYRLRCEHGDPLPEGELLRDTAPNKTQETALQVKTEQSGELYLRGFVGERFDGSRWTELPNRTVAQYSGLFYWLHQYGFSSAAQPLLALRQAGINAEQTVQVTSVSACERYAFLPWGGSSAELFDPDELHDSVWLADGKAAAAQVPAYEKSSLFNAQNVIASQPKTDYLNCERAYAAFVYGTMLDVPEPVRAVFQRQIDVQSDAALADKICFVLDWLGACAQTASPQPFSGDDAIVWFLEQSKSGSDAAFATAAALMLRYLGVPARYAEGYYVSASAGETNVKKSDARVWTEYYLDGVGWVPLETVPDRAQEERQFYSAAAEGAQNPLRRAEVRQPQKPLRPGKTPQTARLVLRAALIALLASVLALWIVLLIRRLRFKARMRRLRALPDKEKIAALYGHAQHICAVCGVTMRDAEAAALCDEALFSDHVMTAQQAETMQRFADEAVAACKRADSGLKRIRHILWDRLY